MRAAIALACAPALALVVGGCGGHDKPAPAAPAPLDTSSDEEPDDGVELVSARGHMQPADVEAGIAPHAAALESCYKSRLGKRRWLGGKLELTWDISKDAQITAVRVASSDLGAWPVEKCLLEVARQMTFAPPRGGDADFTIPLEFSARGSTQWWDEDRAAQVVGARADGLADCARDGASPPSDVVVTIYVGTRGKVQSVGFASTAQPLEDGWSQCAADMIAGWQLVDPRGQIAKLTYRYNAGASATNAGDEDRD